MTRLSLLAAAGLSLGACTSFDSVFPSSNTKPAPVIAPDAPKVTGAPEVKRINKSGGTKIAVLVNSGAITTNDIRRRANFVKLRRMKGNANAIARKELIEEQLKMQEARRINAVASKAQVDAAYANFAKRNKMPQAMLDKVLAQRGVTKDGFKQFIRAQMSWQRAVGARLRAEGGSANAATDTKGPKWLASADRDAGNEQEFTLQQVVFTVPQSKRAAQLSSRTAQAKSFRSRINGCDNTRQLAASLRDVAVLDRGRMRASELPPVWRKDVETTALGKATRVKQTDKGAEMLVVCRSREVRARGSKEEDLFASGDLQQAASALEKKYLAELRKVAVIKER